MRIALTGDVMLGRLVDQYVVQNRSVRPEALWDDVLPLMLNWLSVPRDGALWKHELAAAQLCQLARSRSMSSS